MLCCQGTRDRTRENSLKLCQGKSRLDERRNFFVESGVRHEKGLLRKVVESPALELSEE